MGLLRTDFRNGKGALKTFSLALTSCGALGCNSIFQRDCWRLCSSGHRFCPPAIRNKECLFLEAWFTWCGSLCLTLRRSLRGVSLRCTFSYRVEDKSNKDRELRSYPNFGSVKVTVKGVKRQATDWQDACKLPMCQRAVPST